jgi:hypothetical protein
MSNNKLWVKWNKSSDGSSSEEGYYWGQIIGLANDAIVADLRRAFMQQYHLQVNEDAVEVREEENGEMLKASSSLFVMDSAATATPAWGGQSKASALFLTLPPPQHNDTVSFDFFCCFLIVHFAFALRRARLFFYFDYVSL